MAVCVYVCVGVYACVQARTLVRCCRCEAEDVCSALPHALLLGSVFVYGFDVLLLVVRVHVCMHAAGCSVGSHTGSPWMQGCKVSVA